MLVFIDKLLVSVSVYLHIMQAVSYLSKCEVYENWRCDVRLLAILICAIMIAGCRDSGSGDSAQRKAESDNVDSRKQAATDGTVTFEVTTVSAKHRYAPKHVLAIWITDHKGNYVKTLKIRAKDYLRFLSRWKKVSKGDMTDADTSASLKTHESHKVKWDCRNKDGKLVPDGEYIIFIEFSEKNGLGPVTGKQDIRFMKGTKAIDVSPDDLQNFKKMRIVYTPKK